MIKDHLSTRDREDLWDAMLISARFAASEDQVAARLLDRLEVWRYRAGESKPGTLDYIVELAHLKEPEEFAQACRKAWKVMQSKQAMDRYKSHK